MSDEMEKISITVADTRGSCTRIITDEYEVSDTCWPHLVEVFLEQLQGLGYKFLATPEEMADVLAEYHQELVCAECGGCDDEYASEDRTIVGDRVPDIPPDPINKYPYTGMIKNKDGITIVEFTGHNIGKCVYTRGHEGNLVGQISDLWDETLFEKVSK